MRLAARRDVLDGIQAAAPCFGHARLIPARVLGADDGTPQLFRGWLGSEARAGRPGSRARRTCHELELGERLRRIDDLGPDGLDQRDVNPPVITPGEWLPAHERERRPEVAGSPGAD